MQLAKPNVRRCLRFIK